MAQCLILKKGCLNTMKMMTTLDLSSAIQDVEELN